MLTGRCGSYASLGRACDECALGSLSGNSCAGTLSSLRGCRARFTITRCVEYLRLS